MTELLVSRTDQAVNSDSLGYVGDLPKLPVDSNPLQTHLFINIVCEHCGKVLDVPVYCGDRFCPICGKARQSRVRHRLKFLAYNCEVPVGHRLVFLTLTIKNQTSCNGMVKHLMKSFRKLRNRVFWKKRVHGGAFVIEISGKQGDWHAHIHAVICSRWLEWEKLRDLWLECSGGIGCFLLLTSKSAVVHYLSKYMSKPEMSDLDLFHVNQEMKGVRMFSPIGSWFKLNKLYKLPLTYCKICEKSEWIPLSYVTDQGFRTFEKDISPGVQN